MDGNVLERWWGCRLVDYLKQHRAMMLVEKLWGGIDVVICPGVGASNNHHGVALGCGGGGVVDTVVIDGRLKQMSILLEPKVVSQ